MFWKFLSLNLFIFHVLLFATEGNDAITPQLACSPSDEHFAVWCRFDNTNYIVQSSRFENFSWTTPVDISSENVDEQQPAPIQAEALDSNDTGSVSADVAGPDALA